MQATFNIDNKEVLKELADIKRMLVPKEETGFVIKYKEDEKVKSNVAARFLDIKESQMKRLTDYIKFDGWNRILVKDLLEFKADNQVILQNLEN